MEIGLMKRKNASFVPPHNNGGYLLLRFFQNTAVTPETRFLITLVRLS